MQFLTSFETVRKCKHSVLLTGNSLINAATYVIGNGILNTLSATFLISITSRPRRDKAQDDLGICIGFLSTELATVVIEHVTGGCHLHKYTLFSSLAI